MAEERVVALCLPAGTELLDPGPEDTAKRNVRLVEGSSADATAAVGVGEGGMDALRRAAGSPDVDRLVIVSTVFDEEAFERIDSSNVTAKTLLLFGQADPATGNKHGTLWQKRLPGARLEMVPKAGADLLEPMWHRILRHVAPSR